MTTVDPAAKQIEEYVWISKAIDIDIFTTHAHPIMRRLGREWGVKVTIAGPRIFDPEEDKLFIQAIYDAVERKVSGILVHGWNVAAEVDAVNAAIKNGIPVITVDSDIPASKRLVHVGTDWFRMGAAIADQLVSLIGGSGKVLYMGNNCLTNTQTGFLGFQYRMSGYPAIELFGPEDTTGARDDEAITIEWLKKHPDINGIVGFDFHSGIGIANALERMNLAGKIEVVCVDAEALHIEFIKKGTIQAAYSQRRELFAYQAFQMLYAYNHGSVTTGFQPGLINIAGNIDTGFVIVTKWNADSFEDAFNLDEAIERQRLTHRLTLMSTVVEASGQMTLAVDAAGQIVYANPSGIHLSGISEEQIIGTPMGHIFDLTEAHLSAIEQTAATSTPVKFETTARRINESSFPVQLTISPLMTDTINRGLVIIAADISERKRAEAALQESEERLRHAVKTANVGIFDHDHIADTLYWSPEQRQIFGFEADEPLSLEKVLNHFNPEDIERVTEAVKRSHDPMGDGLFDVDYRIIDRDGGVRWTRNRSCTIFEGEGSARHPVRTIGAASDITEQKRIEEVLLKKYEEEKQFQTLLKALHEIGIELTSIDNLDSFYRGVVESGLKRLGVDRVGFYLYDPERNMALGTYGTDMHGAIQDEAHLQLVVEPNGGMWQSMQSPDRFFYEDNGPLFHNSQIVGTGSRVAITLRHGNQVLGWLVADNLIHQKQLSPQHREILAQYGMFIAATLGRKQAESALRESETRYRSIVETAQEGIWLIDSQAVTTYVNPKMAEILGYTTDEMLGLSLFDFMEESQRSSAQQNFERRSQGIKEQHEFRFKHKNGTDVWVSIATNAIMNDQGQFVAALGMVTDITERKRAADTLREQQRFLQLVLDNIPSRVFWKDTNGKFLGCNRLFAQDVGLQSPNEMIGKDDFTLKWTGCADQYREDDRQVMESGVARLNYEEPQITRENQQSWLQTSKMPLHDTNGKLIGVLGTYQDITERKQMEQDLLLTQFSVDHASIGIMRTGLDARILSVNQHYCELLGYTADELCNMHVYDIDPDYPFERWLQQRANIRQNGSAAFETTHRRKDGTAIRVGITATHVSFQGNEFSVSFIRDITDRKKILEALRMNSFAVEQSADAVYWIDHNALITDVNEATCRMTGYSREELIGMSVADIDDIQASDEVKANLKRICEEGSLRFETRHRTKDQHIFPVEVVVNYISHEGKELYCAFARDISERKRLSEALLLNSFAVEQSADAVYWIDENAVIINVNLAACRMTGYSREEMIGMSVAVIDPLRTENEVKALWKQTKKEGSLRFETQHKSKDGRIFPVEIAGSYIFYEGKELSCAFARDISQRKQAEEELKNSQSLLNESQQFAHTGSWTLDFNTDRMIWSDETYRLFGLQPQEMQPTADHVSRCIHPDDRSMVESHLQDTVKAKLFAPLTYRLVLPDGTMRWIDSTGAVYANEAGVPVRVSGVMQDITARKVSELALQAKYEEELQFQQYLKALHETSIELTMIDNLDEFYQQTVKLGLERFGFDRIGLWLYDAERNMALGTYGTDTNGNLQPESHLQFKVEPPVDMWQALQKPDRFFYEETGELTHNLATVGTGWKVTIALWFGNRNLGWFAVDNLVNGRPITQPQLDILAQYGMFIASSLGRKQIESTLRVSEERLRQVVRTSKIGIFDYDDQNDTGYFSPEHRAIYGWDPNEVLTIEKLFKQVHPDDRARVTANLECSRDPAGDGILSDTEYRITDMRGLQHWLSTRSQTFFEGEGSARHPVRTIGAISDITERKRVEAALQASEERLRQAVRAGNIGIFDHDQVNDIIYWSPEQRRIYGLNQDEPITLPEYFQQVHPDDRERIMQAVQRAHDPTGDGSFDIEHRITDRSGAIHWINTRSRTIFEGDGSKSLPVRTIGAVTDITEHKQMELTLLSSQRRMELALTAAKAGTWEWIVDTGQTIWSEENYLQMGLAPNSIEPNYDVWLRCIHPEDRQMADELVSQHIRQYTGLDMEFRVIWPDGTIHWIHNIAKTRFDESGRRIGTYGIQMDITERKKAETALRESEFFLQKSQTVGRVGSYYLDIRTGKWISSPKLDEIFDIDDRFQKGIEGWISLVHPDQRVEMRQYMQDHVLAKHNRFDKEYRIVRHNDQQERWVYGLGELEFDAQGNIIKMIGTIQDITERKQVETALQESQRRFSKIFHSSPIGISVSRLSDGVMLDINEAGRSILGYEREELIGNSHHQLGSWGGPDDRAKVDREFREKGRVSNHELHFLTKSGDPRTILVSIERMELGGQIYLLSSSLDITERKRAEAALQVSEERLQQAVRAGNIGIFDHDLINNALFWSPEYRNMYGLDPEEPVTLELYLELTHPDEREKIKTILHHGLDSTGDVLDVEQRIIDRHGAVHWLNLTIRTVFEDGGDARHAVRTFGAVLDITERKHAEEALKRSETRFRTLVENSPDYISFLDQDFRIQYINKTHTGTDINSVIGANAVDFALPQYVDSVLDAFVRVLKTGKIEEYDVQAHRNDGTIVWLANRVVPVFEDGKATNFMLVTSDISERKRAENALRESEKNAREFQDKLKALQEISLELAAIESIEEVCSQAIELGHSQLGYDRLGMGVFEDAKQSNITNYGIDDLGELRITHGILFSKDNVTVGHVLTNPSVSFVSEDADLYDEFHNPIGHGWNVVSGLWGNSTSIGWLAADNFFTHEPLIPYQVELLKLYGLTVGHLVIRKRAEAEIRKLNEELEQRVTERTQELQVANDEIKNFAYIVSHDLRAPLVNLKGFAAELRSSLKVVKDGCDEILPLISSTKREVITQALREDIPEALQYIESSVGNMDSFTKAILKLSRLGRLQLEVVTVDTESIVKKTLETLGYQINQQGINVTVNNLPKVAADSVSMEQIFGNILSNAVAYLIPNRPGEIEITAWSTPIETIFRIHDNGRGIAKEDMDKVFAPFRRAGRQDIPGEGMGLAYVQTLVRRHGGRIWCESIPGVGTTFCFTISNNLMKDMP